MNNRKGFILYVVITILLALAILAFALNDFKRGAVTQLAKNIDQNRLILIAQSANAEALAEIRIKVNDADQGGNIFKNFREIFKGKGSLLNKIIPIISFEPTETLKIIKESGYPIKVKTTATIKCFKDSAYKSLSAYNGFLEISSKAYLKDDPKNSMEVSQRHDIRLNDLRHNLDKYVLFLKQFCADLNNTQRSIWLGGVSPMNGDISRVYLGDYNYPETANNCSNDDKKIWLDINFASTSIRIQDSPFRKEDGITGKNSLESIFNKKYNVKSRDGKHVKLNLESFPDNPEGKHFLYTNKMKFKDIKERENIPNSAFFHVQAIKKTYEDFVNDAADACRGGKEDSSNVQRTERKTGRELKQKCQDNMPKTNSNSAAYKICEDYVKNYQSSSNELDEDGNDYSKCEIFNKVLNTCIDNWVYCYGYIDASNIWDFKDLERPKLPLPLAWSTKLAYRGLTDKTVADGYGPFVSAYKGYNPEEYQVGKMLHLYGQSDSKMVPVLVEGNVWTRFFKIAYFDDFEDKITLYNNQEGKIHPEPVPIMFKRHNLTPETFQNKKLKNTNFSPSGYFSDNSLMSQPITAMPVNALILGKNGIGPEYYDGKGMKKRLNKAAVYSNEFLKPSMGSDPLKFGRLLDVDKISYNYPSPKEFLEDRLDEKNVVHLDGIMYIEQGNLDLSKTEKGEEIATYTGRGLIYLAKGNVTLGVFKKSQERQYIDWCGFYLRDGDFIIKATGGCNHIMASMVALSNDIKKSQGTVVLNNNQSVSILGNLILDRLSTRNLAKINGAFEVNHDGVIYDPGMSYQGKDDKVHKNSPYHISIGKIKTAYSIRAGVE